ncbi:hypothetical protein K439DRAFT_1610396 [Ramaria rubella]|nr:hypothetical protein K439DRAFT_1610396 [Ramaria rubella]
MPQKSTELTELKLCMCEKFCKGGKEIARSTWYKHVEFRPARAVPKFVAGGSQNSHGTKDIAEPTSKWIWSDSPGVVSAQELLGRVAQNENGGGPIELKADNLEVSTSQETTRVLWCHSRYWYWHQKCDSVEDLMEREEYLIDLEDIEEELSKKDSGSDGGQSSNAQDTDGLVEVCDFDSSSLGNDSASESGSSSNSGLDSNRRGSRTPGGHDQEEEEQNGDIPHELAGLPPGFVPALDDLRLSMHFIWAVEETTLDNGDIHGAALD